MCIQYTIKCSTIPYVLLYICSKQYYPELYKLIYKYQYLLTEELVSTYNNKCFIDAYMYCNIYAGCFSYVLSLRP